METIGSVIARLRGECGLSQKDLAMRLRDNGIDVTNQAISKWENGASQPSASQFLTLCRILRVGDVLGAFAGEGEEGLLSGLNRRGQDMVREYADLLRLSGRYREEIPRSGGRVLPLYRIPASAGTGQFLDGDDFEPFEAGGDVPASADFGVRLSGDSMEPALRSGDVVWVEKDPVPRPGEIGLFLWQGEVYCKKLETDGEKLILRSLNPAYPPIPVDEDGDFRVFGRVAGHTASGE